MMRKDENRQEEAFRIKTGYPPHNVTVQPGLQPSTHFHLFFAPWGDRKGFAVARLSAKRKVGTSRSILS